MLRKSCIRDACTQPKLKTKSHQIRELLRMPSPLRACFETKIRKMLGSVGKDETPNAWIPNPKA